MSADLLAAFGSNEAATARPQPSTSSSAGSDASKVADSTWQPWPTQPTDAVKGRSKSVADHTLWKTSEEGNDVLFDADELKDGHDDEFGDFEQAEDGDESVAAVRPNCSRANVATALIDFNDLSQEVTSVSPTTLTLHPGTDRGNGGAAQGTEHSTLNKARETELIEDDVWGHFETVKPREDEGHTGNKGRLKDSARQDGGALDLLDDNLSPGQLQCHHKSSTNAQLHSEGDELDAWDNFGDWEVTNNNQSDVTRQTVLQEQRAMTRTPGHPPPSFRLDHQERPTNVPPPAIVLSLMSKVVSQLASEARQTPTVEKLGAMALWAYRVSARVIAGRAQRWKRDTMLAQSMRIGVAGRSGGMKLAAIDKGESRKEDQAAEDLISCWNRVSHALSPAMMKAKVQKPPMSLSLNLNARPLTGVDVISANHICPVCGLKRNERINGIDVNISDTFGEFWIEKWGHTECGNIWYTYRELLDQR